MAKPTPSPSTRVPPAPAPRRVPSPATGPSKPYVPSRQVQPLPKPRRGMGSAFGFTRPAPAKPPRRRGPPVGIVTGFRKPPTDA
jgi:hypothetical protein